MSAPPTARPSAARRHAEQGSSVFERRVRQAFEAFVADEHFPCLPAKGVLRRREYELGVYRVLGSPGASDALATDLAHFADRARRASDGLTSYVAVFSGRAPASERAFERRLWAQLQRLHERDDPAIGWDPTVSSDPESHRFSFSMAGCALFVVGMHPQSSRLARRFRWPALVFNPHAQFERLRSDGTFDRLRDVIRERDTALQGSPNPALADFGARSEARQYSGRDTSDAEWRCPFHPRTRR